jgi:hypothetical protein
LQGARGGFETAVRRPQRGARRRADARRQVWPGGERYYRLDIPDRNYLMGKDAIYVGSMASDEDILELFRVGVELAMCGLPAAAPRG